MGYSIKYVNISNSPITVGAITIPSYGGYYTNSTNMSTIDKAPPFYYVP